MAKIKFGYPIVSATGRFAGGYFRRGSQELMALPAPRNPKKTGDSCPCKAWLYADRLWVMGVISDKAWREALKAPHMSNYDLWMHEAVSTMVKGHYAPDAPSISGGYSTSKIEPGKLWQPSRLCIPRWDTEISTTLAFPGPVWDDWQINFVAADDRTPSYGIDGVEVWFHPAGLQLPGYRVLAAPGDRVAGLMLAYHPYQPFWRFRSVSKDGLFNDVHWLVDSEVLAIKTWSEPRHDWQRLGEWE